jgi:3-hydroxyacyl-[acyl-carrier protein] dehydratase/trans-2-decenoyl-[acyl-carrier protein] isomerase
MVLDTAKKLTYHVNVKRVIMRKLVMGIADGVLKCDGQPVFEVKDMRVALFSSSDGA